MKTKHDLITDYLFNVKGQFHQPDYDLISAGIEMAQTENISIYERCSI